MKKKKFSHIKHFSLGVYNHKTDMMRILCEFQNIAT